jgi:hypothetical protein
MLAMSRLSRLARRVPVAALMPARPVVQARAFGAMALARRVPASVAPAFQLHARGLCSVTVDMTCRVYSLKVGADDETCPHCLLLSVCCPLPAARCLLPSVCCPVSSVC